LHCRFHPDLLTTVLAVRFWKDAYAQVIDGITINMIQKYQGEAQEAEVADEDPVAQEPTLGGAIQSLKPKGNFCACSSTEETAKTPLYAIWFTLAAGELGREPLVAIITPLKNMFSVEDD
jgi:hypothetical protein